MNLSSAEFAHSAKTGLYFGTSLGDSLHGMSNAIFWENKKNVTNLLSAEFAHSVRQVCILEPH